MIALVGVDGRADRGGGNVVSMGRYSTVRRRRLTGYEQMVERVASSRAGAWMFVHVLSPVDRRLLPLTGGRISLTHGAPVGILETVGARTGRRRLAPLLYLAEGETLVVVASNGGSARDPGWLHNVRVRPVVRFLSRERGWRAYRARVATGAERARRWALVTDFYAGYGVYQDRTGGREVDVVVLEPLTAPR